MWGVSTEAIARHAAFAFHAGVKTLLLSINSRTRRALIAGDEQPRAALEEARSRGLTMVALTGDPAWARPETDLPKSLGELLMIQRKAFAFDGLHLDIEPHVLRSWSGPDRGWLARGYLAFLERVRMAPGCPALEAALHPTYSRIPSPLTEDSTLLESVLRKLDGASLMACRNDVGRTLAWAEPALKVIAHSGRPWRCGVLVHESTNADGGVSYHKFDKRRFL